MTRKPTVPSLETPLGLALPKGRLQDGVLALLADAGVDVQLGGRAYRPTVSLDGVEAKLLKPQNVVEMLAVGARDLGFAGADWASEKDAPVTEILDTGLNPVRIVAAAPAALVGADGALPERRLVVASEYVRLAEEWIERRGLDARVLRTYGATEVFPPEDADVIVDNTSTGATLRANGLVIVDEVLRSSTRLFASGAAAEDPGKRARIDEIAMLLRSVLDARARVMLELNVEGTDLDAVLDVLPCMRQPTISGLRGDAGYAVRAAVPRREIATLVPRLKELGGADIVISRREPTRVMTRTTSTRPGVESNATLAPPYETPRPSTPFDLWLAGNEGRPPEDLERTAGALPLNRYPSTDATAKAAALAFGVRPDQVLVTAGADDALLRIALAFLGPGREIVLPVPTFEMIERYARIAGGDVVHVPWEPGAPFPSVAVQGATSTRTRVITVVSPNNPTGSVARLDDVQSLARRNPSALVVLDEAYVEFAERSLAQEALEQPNVVVLRTMSKAYGCAGLRVGFALGQPDVLRALRGAGNPYPCATPSLALAQARLGQSVNPFVDRVREERARLVQELMEFGLRAFESHGNFVYAEGSTRRLKSLRELLLGTGIAIRMFDPRDGRPAAVRITCPGDPSAFDRLQRALRTALAPEAILFDMDGVLADVSRSFRTAIVETAASFDASVTDEDIDAAKAAGGANDDWELTFRLVAQRGVTTTLAEVTKRFEALYQGTPESPGLRATESLLVDRSQLESIRARRPMGIVTGRPRADASRFLEEQKIADLFDVVIAREDAALKPSPAPTRAALTALGVERAWLVGDTPDDVRSARGAQVIPVGVVPPTEDVHRRDQIRDSLHAAGAGVVLERTADILEMIP